MRKAPTDRARAWQSTVLISPSGRESSTNLALLMHEFATNAVKYGALSTLQGCVDVATSVDGDQFTLVWTERGGPTVTPEHNEGFGTHLGQATVNRKRWLNGTLSAPARAAR